MNAKNSPLYTSKKDAEAKAATSKRLGRDKDGAYRVGNRIDRET